MKIKFVIALFILLLLVLAVGCQKQQPPKEYPTEGSGETTETEATENVNSADFGEDMQPPALPEE